MDHFSLHNLPIRCINRCECLEMSALELSFLPDCNNTDCKRIHTIYHLFSVINSQTKNDA